VADARAMGALTSSSELITEASRACCGDIRGTSTYLMKKKI
jgi:hypothetical protein